MNTALEEAANRACARVEDIFTKAAEIIAREDFRGAPNPVRADTFMDVAADLLEAAEAVRDAAHILAAMARALRSEGGA